MQTYLFYDLETTGLNKCFDQVMQFAAIRTDLELNELERHEIFVKINPDVIPSPEALITHRISLAQANAGAAEVEAISEIHQLLNRPGTISVGYNTLTFDDEFLRFSFYRNLLAPYTHQYANQCGRMDLYPIAILYYLYCPEALTWPKKNGKISMKLENLSAENQLAVGQAHNAIVDVEATIALAKKLKAHDEMWRYATGYFDKQTDTKRLLKLPGEAIAVLGKLGARYDFQAPVLSLGQHQHYKNQSLWLRLDFNDFSEVKENLLTEESYVMRKRAGEAPLLLPPEPRFLAKIDDKRLALADKNKEWLANNPNKLEQLKTYYREFKYPDIPNIDLDAALYQRNFPSKFDENQLKKFHQLDLDDKLAMAKQIADELYQEQAIRLIARNYPNLLDEQSQQQYNHYLAQINSEGAIVDYKGEPHLTTQKAAERIRELMTTDLDEQQMGLLEELARYLKY